MTGCALRRCSGARSDRAHADRSLPSVSDSAIATPSRSHVRRYRRRRGAGGRPWRRYTGTRVRGRVRPSTRLVAVVPSIDAPVNSGKEWMLGKRGHLTSAPSSKTGRMREQPDHRRAHGRGLRRGHLDRIRSAPVACRFSPLAKELERLCRRRRDRAAIGCQACS